MTGDIYDPDPPPRPGRCQRLPDVGERKTVSRAANIQTIRPETSQNQDHAGPVVRPGGLR